MAPLDKTPPPPSACPVDSSARAAWLEQSSKPPHPFLPPSPTSPATAATASPSPPPRILKTRPLASDRETSSIPRSTFSPSTTTSNPSSSPTSSPSQNWIYPSEKMFFDALLRKHHHNNNHPTNPNPNSNFNPAISPSTIASIVPIHNAVNERAWSLILRNWELRSPSARAANASCGGPRLRNFSGDSSKLSPRARWLGWLGYERPFDRHDWVVERCGGECVEYVIDFYRGRAGSGGGGPGGGKEGEGAGGGAGSGGRGSGVSFYLDVRPKLNSWAGWRMRMGKWVGL